MWICPNASIGLSAESRENQGLFCHVIQREKETRIVQCLTYERDNVDNIGQDLTAVKGGPIFVPTIFCFDSRECHHAFTRTRCVGMAHPAAIPPRAESRV